jgi:cytochrome P450
MNTLAGDELDERITRLVESNPQDVANPYPLYHELLDRSPVHRWGTTVLVTRFADVQTISRDSVTFSNRAYSIGSRARSILERLSPDEQRVFHEVSEFEAMYISRADGEQHARLRGIAHRAFTPRKMAELDTLAQRYTDELLSDMLESGENDFVAGFSSRLPAMMICSLLEVPLADIGLIRGWTARLGKNRGGQVTADLLDAHAALSEFRDYVAELVAHHRHKPDSTDLVSALIGASANERLSDDELLATMVVLLFGGTDTTTALLGNGLHALLTQHEQWELLCRAPEQHMATALEEIARYVTPVQTTWRVTTAPVRIGKIELEQEQTILVVIGAANRDRAIFNDPDVLDITRDPNHHIAYWFGTHFCLGASLARLEARIVFQTLARRFPNLNLTATDTLPWRGNIQFRTLATLPVDLGEPHT